MTPIQAMQIDLKVDGTTVVPRDGTTFNYGPLNYFQRPDKRFTFGAFGHYEVNEHFDGYAELMFMDDRSVSQIAPAGAFYVTDTLSCENSLLSDQQREVICNQYLNNAALITQLELLAAASEAENPDLAPVAEGEEPNELPDGLAPHPLLGRDGVVRQTVSIGKRNVEGGNRQQDLRHTSFRIVLGGRGDINDTWRYDVSYQYSEVSMENTYLNDLSITRITNALDVVEMMMATTSAARAQTVFHITFSQQVVSPRRQLTILRCRSSLAVRRIK